MKKYILYAATAAVLIILSACSTANYSGHGDASKAVIGQMINARDFTIDVNRALPQRGRSVSLSAGYSISIAGDSVFSHLPYYGRAYSLPYGGGEGLLFEGLMTDYTSVINGQNGRTTINFKVRTHEDRYEFTLDIWPSGSANVSVRPGNKQFITFYGEMDSAKWLRR